MTPICDYLWAPAIAVSVATIAYSVAVLQRFKRGIRAAPPVDRWNTAPPPVAGWPSVCVIVPAHNEADVIARLAESLLSQDYPALSVVFALDRCTDRTRAEIERVCADDERVEVIEIDACPDDWAGKTHAIHTAVEQSRAAKHADVFTFTDADTWFGPSCVRATVSAMRERNADMLSLLSTLDAHTLWEHALQPAAVMALLRQHPIDRVNDPVARRAFANGQFLMFASDAYRAVGGHEAVKDDLLEDIAFAFKMKRAERTWAVLPAGGALRCRMYDSPRAFHVGWRRIYLESARRIPGRLRAWGAEFALTGAVAPLACVAFAAVGILCTGPTGWLSATASLIALAFWLYATSSVWKAQGAPRAAALLAPLGAIVVAHVMFAAAQDLARGREVRWGGRSYVLKPRPRPRS